ncbi:MAG TPA: hypothetical protein VJC13_02015 [Candidatus Paceibacterota bacterium]|nr:hypothetical protein [uncultured archaeon]
MEENKSGIGSIIGTIIIIAIIILGGLYFWGKRVEESKVKENVDNSIATTTSQSEAEKIKSTSESDSLDSIDADLSSTNTTNLNSEASTQSY